jgi:hypothetical protein
VYYVYAYLRASDNTPYYIGKGKNKRAFSVSSHAVSVPKDKTKIVFLEKNLSNVGACALERRYILWYGRKDLGTGILLNRTEGGDGNTGMRSKEWRENHSKKMMGENNPSKRIEVKNKQKLADKSYMKTNEYKKKLSDGCKKRYLNTAHPRAQIIQIDGIIYKSLRHASKELKISRHKIKLLNPQIF